MIDTRGLVALLAIHLCSVVAISAPPRPLDDRLELQLVAKEPDIVTPTGIAVDGDGRIWVLENHTHQRPEGYKGPKTDRIRIFEDFDPDGRARKITTFAEGFVNSMGLIFGDKGTLFVATRSDVHKLGYDNRRDKPTSQQVIVKLETKADYPHNGLSGLAVDALGELYFGLGENFGATYRLVGSDGSVLTGGGEGGSVYRCRQDGSRLRRIATGFWNPFHLAFDMQGRLYTVDNDPDSRGPCRLLHLVQEGDYGYRFRYGRRGVHPFQSWNGELPGTLPMAAGTGEAPSGILCYDASVLPRDYHGKLLVTSWGDHVLELFDVTERGASVTATNKTIVRGGEDFRPVGIAQAPDGSIVLSDWVDKSYPVHGQGRIWRLKVKKELANAGPQQEASPLCALCDQVRLQEEKARPEVVAALRHESPYVRAEAARLLHRWEMPLSAGEREALQKVAISDPHPWARLQALLALPADSDYEAILTTLAEADPFLQHGAATALANQRNLPHLVKVMASNDAKMRLGALAALRRADPKDGSLLVPKLLLDADLAIRQAAMLWVAEEKLTQHVPLLEKGLQAPPRSRALLATYLAAKDTLARDPLAHDPSKEPSPDALLLTIVKDSKQDAELRALALTMLRSNEPGLPSTELHTLAGGKEEALRQAAVRMLSQRTDPTAQEFLLTLLREIHLPLALRRHALIGLSEMAGRSPQVRQGLLARLDEPALRHDALRSLRQVLTNEELASVRSRAEGWQKEDALSSAERRELTEQLVLLGKQPKAKARSVDEWRDVLANGTGDAERGEMVFFHPRGPRCHACHRIDGRGEHVGPDLSHVGASHTRDRLIESILEPSKEIAPLFTSWTVLTSDGKVRTGVIADVKEDSTFVLVDNEGKKETLRRLDVEDRRASSESIMPKGLPDLMTQQEFLDLLAYLQSRK